MVIDKKEKTALITSVGADKSSQFSYVTQKLYQQKTQKSMTREKILRKILKNSADRCNA